MENALVKKILKEVELVCGDDIEKCVYAFGDINTSVVVISKHIVNQNTFGFFVYVTSKYSSGRILIRSFSTFEQAFDLLKYMTYDFDKVIYDKRNELL